MEDLHDDDSRAPARVRVPVDGVEERLGDGLKLVFRRAVPGCPLALVTLDSRSKMREDPRWDGTYRSGSHSPSAIPKSFWDAVLETIKSCK
jgi:hypothetical protein